MEDLGRAMARAATALARRAMLGTEIAFMADEVGDAVWDLMMDPDLLYDIFGLPANDVPMTAHDVAAVAIEMASHWAQGMHWDHANDVPDPFGQRDADAEAALDRGLRDAIHRLQQGD